MEEEMKQEALRQEIDEIKSQLGSLNKKSYETAPRATGLLFISSFQIFTGLIFLSLFFLGLINQFNIFLTLGFFIVGFLGLIPFLTDVFTKKIFKPLRLIGGVILLILASAYYFLWEKLLNSYLEIIFLVITVIFLLIIFFFLIHAYLAYLKRIAYKELKVLSIIVLSAFLLMLTQLVYLHFILLTLYFILVSLFLKGMIDLTERFRI